MIAFEVDHDVIAALVGGLTLIVVATLPILWRRVDSSRREDREARVDLLALRERLDMMITAQLNGHERRYAEHEEIKAILRDCMPRRKESV